MAIITISRGTFSGGKILAERLAERLGYPCSSREEILQDAARDYGVAENELSAAINEPPPFWQEVPGKRIAYLKCLTAALLDRIEGENLVYHGHVGHLLLGDITHVLRIRVIADMAYRIKECMERLNMAREETVSYIEKVDRERDRWTRFLYGVNWQDASHYDVVLNLERMSPGGACETVARIVELDDFKPTENSRKVLNDLALSSRVWIALAKDERTKASFVKVAADNGKVLVSGNVTSGAAMDAIPIVTKEVEGVLSVNTDVGMGSDWYW